MIALRPEAQTLLTVVQTVASDKPPAIAHCRAGFWPRLCDFSYLIYRQLSKSYFADRTLPKKISSTCSGLISGTRSTAAIKPIST